MLKGSLQFLEDCQVRWWDLLDMAETQVEPCTNLEDNTEFKVEGHKEIRDHLLSVKRYPARSKANCKEKKIHVSTFLNFSELLHFVNIYCAFHVQQRRIWKTKCLVPWMTVLLNPSDSLACASEKWRVQHCKLFPFSLRRLIMPRERPKIKPITCAEGLYSAIT